MANGEEELSLQLGKIISKHLQVPREVLPHHDLIKDLALDSVGLAGLMVALEDQYEVNLSPSILEKTRTVTDLARVILSLKGGAA